MDAHTLSLPVAGQSSLRIRSASRMFSDVSFSYGKYRDVPRCLFFTRVPYDCGRNQCVCFTWFLKVMVLTMVFELFSLGFPMYFHGDGFWESPHSSQKPPVAPERSLKPPGPKVEGPEAQSLTW